MAEGNPAPAFPQPGASARPDAGIWAAEPRGLGVATLTVPRAGAAALASAIGFMLPERPAVAGGRDLSLVGLGPGNWLALGEGAGVGFAAGLADRLRGVAHVSDQSSGYAMLRLGGARVRDLLAKGAFLDFDAGSFAPGDAAATTIAHMNVILWCDDDDRFSLAVFRSFAGSLWHWLVANAAEFGLDHRLRA